MKKLVSFGIILAPALAFAEDARQLGTHAHGVGKLNIAIDETDVVLEFSAPGADIVGFEYAATSNADRSAVDAALETLADPLAIFVMPEAAGCSLVAAEVRVASEDDGNDHEGEAQELAEDAGAEGPSHSEFQALYNLSCDRSETLTSVDFTYFGTFPNAQEIVVQMVSSKGAMTFEVERDTPLLTLGH